MIKLRGVTKTYGHGAGRSCVFDKADARFESGANYVVFGERGSGLRKLGQAMLAPHAHTVAVDPRTHLVYFPLERGASGRPELLIMAPA